MHLGTKDCKAEFLVEFLKHHDCNKLYLVGDIIDGWKLKRNIYWPKSHTNVVRRILTLSKRGTEIFFITGNHDGFLRKYSYSSFGNIHLVDEFVHTTADGRRFLVLHGDKFDVVVCYGKWLTFLGDATYSLLLFMNHWFNKIRYLFGFEYWSLSAYVKQRVRHAVSYIGDYVDAVARECRQRNYDGIVCGHIHHAEIRRIEGVDYHNCGDWVESCTALVETTSGKIELVHWIMKKINSHKKGGFIKNGSL